MPAHRKPQSRRATLYTVLVLGVAIFAAIIGFGGAPKHSAPATVARSHSPTPTVTTSTAPVSVTPSASVTSSAKPRTVAKATPKTTAKPKAEASPRPKPRPTATSTGVGTSDASLKVLSQRVRAQPVRIQIPALHVDAAIIPVGVSKSGALEVPENVVQAAWFQAGSAPGQRGTAILAAHVDFDGKLGLFNGLHMLKTGDLIYVTDAGNHVHRFSAALGRLFPKSDPTTVRSLAAASAKPGLPQLALITCGGALNSQRHSYYDNFVLLANA